jgi:hypothetical protein
MCMPCGHQCVCKAEKCGMKTEEAEKCPYCKADHEWTPGSRRPSNAQQASARSWTDSIVTAALSGKCTSTSSHKTVAIHSYSVGPTV